MVDEFSRSMKGDVKMIQQKGLRTAGILVAALVTLCLSRAGAYGEDLSQVKGNLKVDHRLAVGKEFSATNSIAVDTSAETAGIAGWGDLFGVYGFAENATSGVGSYGEGSFAGIGGRWTRRVWSRCSGSRWWDR